ncbi:MAG: ParB N-terminal domain-containing protein [Patescibacteria group bacterium]|nr:ParB N-terminal domain-containing protein [Patescibacteria group bacterium]
MSTQITEQKIREPNRIIEVSPDDLETSVYQTRIASSYSKDGIKGLADDIKQNKLLHIPTVRPSPFSEGKYELIEGHRRFEALKLLKWESIRVGVYDGLSEEEVFKMVVCPNIHAETYDALEIAKIFREAQTNPLIRVMLKVPHDENGLNPVEQIAEKIGIKRSTGYKYDKLGRKAEQVYLRVNNIPAMDEKAKAKFRSCLTEQVIDLILKIKADDYYGKIITEHLLNAPESKDGSPQVDINKLTEAVDAEKEMYYTQKPGERPQEDTEKAKKIAEPVLDNEQKIEETKETVKKAKSKLKDIKDESARAQAAEVIKQLEEAIPAVEQVHKDTKKQVVKQINELSPVIPDQTKEFDCVHSGKKHTIRFVMTEDNENGTAVIDEKIPIPFTKG